MMKAFCLGMMLLITPLVAFSLINCDLTEFRWLCEIPVQAHATHHTPSVVDCDGTLVFITPSQYEVLMRYQRASVNMVLNVNGEYISSPCVPAQF